MRNGYIVGIVSSGILVLAAGLVCKEVIAQKFSNKVKALEKSAEWYVGDVNLPETEERFVRSLEDLSNDPDIETAQSAQRASMLNLFAIYNASKEMPWPLPYHKLSEFTQRADVYLERLTLVEGHDEFVAHYRSRVEWRKDLATVISDYGPESHELFYFLDASVKVTESEEHKKKMAELDRVWEERYATPQGRIDKELFLARREVFLDGFKELRDHWIYRIKLNAAKLYHELPQELIPQ